MYKVKKDHTRKRLTEKRVNLKIILRIFRNKNRLDEINKEK